MYLAVRRKKKSLKKSSLSRAPRAIDSSKQLKKIYFIAGISLSLVILLGFFFFYFEIFSVGKAGETNQPTCVEYCSFKSNYQREIIINVPVGKTVFTLIEAKPEAINVHVSSISGEGENKRCNFELIPVTNELRFNEPSVWSLKKDETVFYGSLQLINIGCDSCFQAHDLSYWSAEFPTFGELYLYQTKINFSYQPNFVQTLSGINSDKCVGSNSKREYFCGGENLNYTDIPCPENFTCHKGLCIQIKEENYLGRKSINLIFNLEVGTKPYISLGSLTDSCKDENNLVNLSVQDNEVIFTEKPCPQGCYNNRNGGVQCFDGCQDTDGENISTKGNVTGLSLENWGDRYFKRIATISDGCFSKNQTVEQICGSNGLIDKKIIDCSSRTVCIDGACLFISPLSITQSDKSSTYFQSKEKVTAPFWVVTTLKDVNGTVLLLQKEFFSPQPNYGYQAYQSNTRYHDANLISSKEVLIYDIPDPSKWKVYLNGTYLQLFNNS